MIQGVKIQISSEELKQHVLSKVKLHEEKATFYTNRVTDLEKGVEEDKVDGSLYNSSNNPVNSLKQSGRQHKEKAQYFKFIADHIINDETYELTENDLTRLEIIGGMYF